MDEFTNIKQLEDHIKISSDIIETKFGKVKNLKQIGKGGNGIVYSGNLLNKDVAIKFLVNTKQSSKLTRFKAEYFNILALQTKEHIVKVFHYDELHINENLYPYIIMKKYENSLDSFLKSNQQIAAETFIKIFNFFLDSLEVIHENNIVHRDLKPENILIDGDKFVLSDFGISFFDPNKHIIQAKTEKGDRIANYKFRAPEQLEKDLSKLRHPTVDIYSMALICQWIATGQKIIHSGTSRDKITNYISGTEIIDSIIEKCLANNPNQRFQSIKEIREAIKVLSTKKLSSFDVINAFQDCIAKCFPKGNGTISKTNDPKKIDGLLNDLSSKTFQGNDLNYRFSSGYMHISQLKKLDSSHWLLNEMELKITEVWAYYDNLREYLNFIILKCDPANPFGIYENSNEVDFELAGLYDNKQYISYQEYDSGYADICGETIKINGNSVIRKRFFINKMFFIYTKYNSLNAYKMDEIIKDYILETKEGLMIDENNLMELSTKQGFIFSKSYEENILPYR